MSSWMYLIKPTSSNREHAPITAKRITIMGIMSKPNKIPRNKFFTSIFLTHRLREHKLYARRRSVVESS